MPRNSLYIGKVFHKRHMPFEHAFTYRVFTLLLDLDDVPNLSKRIKFFSFNRFNLFSIHEKDHANRDGKPIRPWIEEAAKAKNIDLSNGKIYMLVFPRILGYVFNPITVYFCYGSDQKLKAVLHQVKNTFGEQHGYLLPVEAEQPLIKQECEKIFHVSPFIHMDCEYKFRFAEPEEKLDFAIHQFQPEGKILTATWEGQRKDLNDKHLLKTLVTHPLLTLKIIVGIHWEALKLWIKGAKYISKPEPPTNAVS